MILSWIRNRSPRWKTPYVLFCLGESCFKWVAERDPGVEDEGPSYYLLDWKVEGRKEETKSRWTRGHETFRREGSTTKVKREVGRWRLKETNVCGPVSTEKNLRQRNSRDRLVLTEPDSVFKVAISILQRERSEVLESKRTRSKNCRKRLFSSGTHKVLGGWDGRRGRGSRVSKGPKGRRHR